MDVFASRSIARRALAALAAFALTWTVQTASAQAQDGEALFNKVCAACHTVGGGVRVGPDLAGVAERRDEAWLLPFIKDSQAVVKSGDPAAVKLFNDFKNIPMPPNPYSDAEIKAVLAYIATAAGSGAGAVPAEVREVTPESIAMGLALFQGTQRLQNGGAACNSCHHVENDAVIGGGVLAKELTTVFSRMGAPGVQAILGKPPFPVMEAAYANHPLTPDEVHGLVSFLQEADKNHQLQTPRDFGGRLFASGTVVFVVLMGLYSLMWRRRKKRSVNQDIYDRQIKTF